MRTTAWLLFVFALFAVIPAEVRNLCRAEEVYSHRFGPNTSTDPGLEFPIDPDRPVVRATATGVSIRHSAVDGVLSTQGGKTRFGVRGDATIRLRFDVQTMGCPDILWGSGVMLRLEFTDSAKTGVTVALQAETDGVLYWMVDYTSGGQAEHEVYKTPAFTDVFEITQVVEVVRRDDTMTISVGAEGDLMPLDVRSVSTTDIDPVAVWVGTGGAVADLEVELKSLDIDSQSLANGSTVEPPTSVWTWMSYGFGGLTLIAIGLYLRSQWRIGE